MMLQKDSFPGKYGYFDNGGREYVITNPFTKRPWVNILSNGDYATVLSQMGTGYSFRGNTGQNLLTRKRQDLINPNTGKFIYVRDKDTGDFFSIGLTPCMAPYEEYEVRQGIGYTIITNKTKGIRAQMRVFVAAYSPVELMEVTLTNERDTDISLDLTAYLEWAPGCADEDTREHDKLFIETRFDKQLNAILVEKHLCENRRGKLSRWNYIGFFAASKEVSSFDTDRESFIGMYGLPGSPQGMKKASLSANQGRFIDPCGCLRCDVSLKAGQSERIVFTLGCSHKLAAGESINELILNYTAPDRAQTAFLELQAFWSSFIDSEEIETPDAAMNIMTNYWFKYQAISYRLWAKASDFGCYSMGDRLQDTLILLHCNPELARKQILRLASLQQFEQGENDSPLDVDSLDPISCPEDTLWLVYVLQCYIDETADYSIYDEVVPFADKGQATVYEHCKRAIENCFAHFSPRSIPQNSRLNCIETLSPCVSSIQGENFWTGEFLFEILKHFVYLAQKREDKAFATKSGDVLKLLQTTVNEYGWDQSWYLQAITDELEKVGAQECRQGKIFLLPQLWAVISGIASHERSETAMKAVTEHLLQECGPLILSPPFTQEQEGMESISRYAPGQYENGGVCTRASAWVVWAYTLINDGERAYDVYKKICPPNRSADIDQYMVEPYVACDSIEGPASPYSGRGSQSFHTGAAQWLHRVCTYYILGIRPLPDGLIIDPCIPPQWDGYRVKRVLRGTALEINLQNPEHVCKGIKSLMLNGEHQIGNCIKNLPQGSAIIDVILGTPE